MVISIPQYILLKYAKKPSVRKQNRSLTRQFARFLKKSGIFRFLKRVNLKHKREKKDSGKSFILEFVLSKIWRTGSVYATNINAVPKNVCRTLGITRFAPKSTFYDEIPFINPDSLENFNDELVKQIVSELKRVIVMLDGHAIKVWSKLHANAAWGATSSEHKFFGYKLLATIIHGLDVVAKHLLLPGNNSPVPFAQSIIEQTLSITRRIDVLLMDREFTDFTFWAWLILQKIGFIIPAKDDNAVTKTIRRTLDAKLFQKFDENTEYYESLAYFPDLRENLRVVFIKKKTVENGKEKIKEYELITNLAPTYSTIEIIKLYPVRQGREDVFDRLKNEFALHKPCKIKDFAGIEAFTALTLAAYNLYALFSNRIYGCYKTVVVLFRAWLFNENEIRENFSFEIQLPFFNAPQENVVQP